MKLQRQPTVHFHGNNLLMLDALRHEKGITIAQLAKATGLDRTTITGIFRGRIRPTLPTAQRFLKPFGLGIEQETDAPTINEAA